MATRVTRSTALATRREIDSIPASVRDERDSKVLRSVSARVLVDSARGVDLNAWLNANSAKLNNSRCFYIVQAAGDVVRGVWKFGYSNLNPVARLRSYVHTYGKGDVRLHVLIRSNYDRNVSRESSYMYRLELRVKRKLAAEIQALGRGDERVAVPLDTLRRLVHLDVVDQAKKIGNALDVATLVDRNRSRRLRGVQGLPALPDGVGRGG